MRSMEGRVWWLFAVCVLFLAAVPAWLTWHTLNLERDRNEAQRQLAEGRVAMAVEERVHSAFWRVDALMSLLLARESARAPSEYLAFRPVAAVGASSLPEGEASGDSTPTLAPSPILEAPSGFVRLHFQIAADGSFTSPQSPVGTYCAQAMGCGVSQASIDRSQTLLVEAESLLSHPEALQLCAPADAVMQSESQPWISEQNRPGPLGNSVAVESGVPLWFGSSGGSGDPAVATDALTADGGFPAAAVKPGQEKLAEYMNFRSSKEVESRARISQSQVANASQSNRLWPDEMGTEVKVGMMRPVWVGGNELLLVRRVRSEGQNTVQCCWLDWNRLRDYLRGEISDLFPTADFTPVRQVSGADPARTSTVLPIRLELPESAFEAVGELETEVAEGGLWPALWATWLSTVLAILALGVMLAGVLRLSARRATFVSAVSHELRTPLTTFRMYSEMLADGVVTEPAAREEYLKTLKTEAERLGHLVDNVLVYAGLEHRVERSERQVTTLLEIARRSGPMLARIAENGGCLLEEHFESGVLELQVRTDPAAVERVLINLVDNAIKYGMNTSRPQIEWSVRRLPGERVALEVRDFGPGIPRDRQRSMFEAFSRSDSEAAGGAPGVGLGLALCRRIAGDLGGELRYSSAEPGSRFQFVIPLDCGPSPCRRKARVEGTQRKGF